jgi:hypothetical protein
MLKNIVIILTSLVFSSHQVKSLNIECEFRVENFTVSNNPWPYYGCFVVDVINLEFENRNIKEVFGEHDDSTRDNSDVETIFFDGIYNAKMPFIPKNLHEFFPNIKMIFYHQVGLLELNEDDLIHFPKLIVFESKNNPIKVIPAGLFKNNSHMDFLEFTGSSFLQSIGKNLLGNLTHLQVAIFVKNQCINEFAIGIEEISKLNEELHILCPPYETSTPTEIPTPPTAPTSPPKPDECPLSCSDRLKNLTLNSCL